MSVEVPTSEDQNKAITVVAEASKAQPIEVNHETSSVAALALGEKAATLAINHPTIRKSWVRKNPAKFPIK